MKKKLLAVLTTGIFIFGINMAAEAAMLNSELMVNGGAEAGNTSGWFSTGIDAVLPDAYSSGFGSYVFTGGTGDTIQTLSQSIDLSSNAMQIDSGQLISSFSINLQQRSDQNNLDQARVDVSFLDSSKLILDSFFFEDVVDIGVFDWNYFSDTRLISAGTRSVEILLTATRIRGMSSDAFFDEASVQISPVPIPGAAWLFGSGLAGLAGARVRRKKK